MLNTTPEPKTDPKDAKDPTKRAGAAPEGPPAAAPLAMFGYSMGMPGIFKSNFDYQFARAMPAGAYGEGGAVGEAYSTARRIVDGDLESWVLAWTETAERVEKIGHACLSGGHVISARDAFLRAAIYWKTGFFYLETKDPRQLAMYTRHRSCFREAAKLFDPPIEPVSIPYENGKTLPGYFMRSCRRRWPAPDHDDPRRRRYHLRGALLLGWWGSGGPPRLQRIPLGRSRTSRGLRLGSGSSPIARTGRSPRDTRSITFSPATTSTRSDSRSRDTAWADTSPHVPLHSRSGSPR